MIKSTTYYVRELLIGIVIFVTVVVGSSYYLQSSLVLVKHYGAYTHWAVLLLAAPALAGIALRLKKIASPLVSCLGGAVASTAALYPLYKTWWATPPKETDAIIYLCIIFGIAYIATQPLMATFMLAFRLGGNSAGKKSRTRKQTASQPIYSEHGSGIALMELLVGICSLGLSIFSVFFLGRG